MGRRWDGGGGDVGASWIATTSKKNTHANYLPRFPFLSPLSLIPHLSLSCSLPRVAAPRPLHPHLIALVYHGRPLSHLSLVSLSCVDH